MQGRVIIALRQVPIIIFVSLFNWHRIRVNQDPALLPIKENVMKQFLKLRIVWILPLVVVLAACSGIPLKDREMALRNRYHEYAGPPVKSYSHFGAYDGWAPIGQYELVVWTTINDAYLITVDPPCDDLMFANRISITQTADTVDQKFDFVKVGYSKCMIKSIQPVDYLKMKKAMRQESGEAKAAGQEKKK